MIEITSDTAVWFHAGKAALPMRWVLVRDPLAKYKTQALLCTDLQANPLQIVKWFIQRMSCAAWPSPRSGLKRGHRMHSWKLRIAKCASISALRRSANGLTGHRPARHRL